MRVPTSLSVQRSMTPLWTFEHVGVGGRARRRQAEGQQLAVGVEVEAADGAGRQAGLDRPLAPARQVVQPQAIDAGLVDDRGQLLAVVADGEALDVPLHRRAERAGLLGGEVEGDELAELALAVGGGDDALAVGGEAGARPDDRHVAGLFGQLGALAGGQVEQPQVALVDRDVLLREDLVAVGGEVRGRPAAALDLGDQLVGGRVARVDDVEVGVLLVAPGRGVGELLAAAGPRAEAVLRGAVGEEGELAVGAIEAPVLRELVAADVLRQHEEAAVADRRIDGPADAVVEEGELAAIAARHLDLVDLGRFGEAGADQQRVILGVPLERGGRARLGVGADAVGDGPRDRRDVLRGQAVRHVDDVVRRRRARDDDGRGVGLAVARLVVGGRGVGLVRR
ncbi:hypothetical protein [Nannocystis pusilla]|uniref:hypothetical protein n=1 Tax=Nannocystis pusilla TaxID=889268 RepID=UPI003DA2778F